jgi:hypothetical protein
MQPCAHNASDPDPVKPPALSLAASLPAYCGLYTGVSLSDFSEPLAVMLALIGSIGLGLAVGCYTGALALGWVISALE